MINNIDQQTVLKYKSLNNKSFVEISYNYPNDLFGTNEGKTIEFYC